MNKVQAAHGHNDNNRALQCPTRRYSFGLCRAQKERERGHEDVNSVISLLKAECFSNTNTLVCDNSPAFKGTKLSEWVKDHGMKIKFCSPYHPAANGLAEHAIRDVNQHMKMYPNFPGGWKCCLEAALRHHKCSSTSGLGSAEVRCLQLQGLYQCFQQTTNSAFPRTWSFPRQSKLRNSKKPTKEG